MILVAIVFKNGVRITVRQTQMPYMVTPDEIKWFNGDEGGAVIYADPKEIIAIIHEPLRTSTGEVV